MELLYKTLYFKSCGCLRYRKRPCELKLYHQDNKYYLLKNMSIKHVNRKIKNCLKAK